MIRRYLALLTIIALVGCSSAQSSYRRTRAAPQELVWAWEGDLLVEQGGQHIALSDLSDVVDCVPEALEHAERADSAAVASNWLVASGLTLMLGGTAAGTYLLIDDIDDNLVAGLSVLGAGLILGTIIAGIGGGQRAQVRPNRLDAVNIYNDEYANRPGCKAE